MMLGEERSLLRLQLVLRPPMHVKTGYAAYERDTWFQEATGLMLGACPGCCDRAEPNGGAAIAFDF